MPLKLHNAPDSGAVRTDVRLDVCEAIKDEFDAWKQRDLSSIELEYLFLDGPTFGCTPALGPSRCWAWSITTQGSPVLVGLAPGSDEGHDP